MTDLVTGSSGLLGRVLVARLRAAGRRLRLFDVLPPPPELAGDGVEPVVADMRDPAALRAAARGVEVVYHLAAGQRMKPQFAAMSEDATASPPPCRSPRTTRSARSAPTGARRSRPSGSASTTPPAAAT
ncbi:MAG: NAD-dependent epimerase/dehydratase family protein [Deltaproteobacteria bacterium]|nr:MAG: NAD-dependent epimerase/dehydratase family protein [Deltaproteobacteria bacterium]